VNIQRIVVGTDFSQSAAHAVDMAMQRARHSDAELVLVHFAPVAEHLEAELPVGSVAEWTARNAGSSVLVVKQGEVEP